jgi:hypothetical protein
MLRFEYVDGINLFPAQIQTFIFFYLGFNCSPLLRAEVPIKVLCGAGEQSSQMPAGLCNACYHSMKEFQPLRKQHKPERARSASFDTSRIVYDDPELLHI